MSEAKHTPGPWRAEQSTWPRIGTKGVWWQIWAEGQGDSDFIADVGRTDNATDADVERDRATAFLIAAAPDLFKEAARIEEILYSLPESLREQIAEEFDEFEEALAGLDAAIAKAKRGAQ